jgi:hypothetical protein
LLLFVRNPYFAAIRDGLKTFEVRAGSRYSRLDTGDSLSINGRFAVRITRRDIHISAASLIRALRSSSYPLTHQQIDACYPGLEGPYYVFWFDAPAK